ncbi:MAG: amidohydrolase [bacterium]|nr:amidohydrolase [bacterium]
MLPDRILTNAYFVTDGGGPTRAVAVSGNRIKAIGGDLQAVREAVASSAKIIDLEGGFAFPGFADSHVHAVNYGRSRMGVPCWPSDVRSVTDIVDRVKAAHRLLEPGKWIKGRGYNPTRLVEGRAPTATELDLDGGRSVVLDSFDFHRRVANHAALEAAGIGPNTPDPPDGEIVRDRHGVPTGELLDGARSLMDKVIPPWSDQEDERAIDLATDYFLSQGFTYVTNAAPLTMSRPGEEVKAFLRMSERGALRLRFTSMIRAELLDAAGELGLRPGVGDDSFRIGGAKMFVDGAFGPRTALLAEPYEDSSSCGSMHLDRGRLEARVGQGSALGWQMCIHAIGDEAVRIVAATLSANPSDGGSRNHRIEHCCLTSAETIAAMSRVGIIPVPQLAFLRFRSADFLDALGEHRVGDLYPLRSWIDAGLKPIHSSDTPVIPDASPLKAVATAVGRVDTDGKVWGRHQAITFEEALAMMTIWPAEADGQARDRGRIAPGYLADFTVFPQDPRLMPPEELAETAASMTLVGGQVAWSDSKAART